MQINKTLITSYSNENNNQPCYSQQIDWSYGSLVNNHNYETELDLITQNPTSGNGMKVTETKDFHVQYDKLKLLQDPIIAQIPEKSALQLNWASILQNPAILEGSYNYITNWLEDGNVSLEMDTNNILHYNTTKVSAESTICFLEGIPRGYSGKIFYKNDGSYQLWYDGTQQKFYTVINGITKYDSEITIITDNPFYFIITPNYTMIRQYSVYWKLYSAKKYKLNVMKDMPLTFLVQPNN